MNFPFSLTSFRTAGPLRRKLAASVAPTGVERTFREDEIIVSKTDLKGHMTYVNEVFLRLAGYTEAEMIGAPHSAIRHPDMPRCIFKLLWDRLKAEKEIFAYVKNMSANGDHYWVLAHVTPSFSDSGAVLSYHSNRRIPDRRVLEQTIVPFYKALLAEEKGHADRRAGLEASSTMLRKAWEEKGLNYDQFIFSL